MKNELITYGIQKTTKDDLARLRAQVQITWQVACKADGIDPKSTFVVFSDHNPFEAQYNLRMKAYLAACRKFEEGR
jgi:hypothetical protein